MSAYPVKRPYKLGERAAKDGEPFDKNPFRSGTYKYDRWRQGYENYFRAMCIHEDGVSALLRELGYPQGHAGIMRVLEDGIKNPKLRDRKEKQP